MDHGVLFGDGVFETARTYGGRVFRLVAHLDRLLTSAAALGLPPVPREGLERWIRETVDRSGLADSQLRITLTRGVGTRGLDPSGCQSATVIIAALPLRLRPERAYTSGIEAGFLWARAVEELPSPEWKSTSYQRSVLARQRCLERGWDEGFFLDPSGNVLEGATSNVFAVIEGTLVTPSRGCLPGITRSDVIQLARARGVTVRQEPLPRGNFEAAGEIFITSSVAEVLPVTRLEGRPVGSGEVGALTRALRADYRRLVEGDRS